MINNKLRIKTIIKNEFFYKIKTVFKLFDIYDENYRVKIYIQIYSKKFKQKNYDVVQYKKEKLKNKFKNYLKNNYNKKEILSYIYYVIDKTEFYVKNIEVRTYPSFFCRECEKYEIENNLTKLLELIEYKKITERRIILIEKLTQ